MAQSVEFHVSKTPMLDILQCDKVQSPPSGPFCSDNLTWYCNKAFIPSHRLGDFVKGENANDEFNTRYSRRKVDDPEMLTDKRIERYWCAYGPRDLRGQKIVTFPTDERPKVGKGSRIFAQCRRLGGSEFRGCLSHFHATFFKNRPDVCLLKWERREHVDEKGEFCHGKLDPRAARYECHIAKFLSVECLEFVRNYLRAGVAPVQVVAEFHKEVQARMRQLDAGLFNWTRDLKLKLKDVLNVKASIQRQQGILFSSEDHIATFLWISKHRDDVIFYQPAKQDKSIPFMLIWGTPWMLHNLAKYGQNRAVSMDATFATNIYDYYLFTVLVYDDFQNGVPCCWALLEKTTAPNITKFLEVVKERVERVQREELGEFGGFVPSCFIIDDAKEEHIAIKTSFPGIPIILCLFHVRQAWLRQIIQKVKCKFSRCLINKELGNLMYGWRSDAEAKAQSMAFMEQWADEQPDFVHYYRTHWHGRLHWWVKQYRTFRRSNQDTTGAIERWHRNLKQFLKADKRDKKGRTIAWLLWIMCDKVQVAYWVQDELKHQGSVRNAIIQKQVWDCIMDAKKIPDSHVHLYEERGLKCARVQSTSRPGKWHELISYDKEHAICTCEHALQGNLCKHQIKCLTMSGYSENELLLVLGAKFGTIFGGMENLELENGTQQTVVVENEDGIALQRVESTSTAQIPSTIPVVEGKELGPTLPFKDHSVDDFVVAITKLLGSIKHNPLLIQEAWSNLNSGIQRTLDMKAKLEVVGAISLADFQRQPFQASADDANFSIQRKKCFLEKMHGRKHVPSDCEETTEQDNVNIPSDIVPFRKNGNTKAKKSMHAKLTEDAHLSINLNATPATPGASQPLKAMDANISQGTGQRKRSQKQASSLLDSIAKVEKQGRRYGSKAPKKTPWVPLVFPQTDSVDCQSSSEHMLSTVGVNEYLSEEGWVGLSQDTGFFMSS